MWEGGRRVKVRRRDEASCEYLGKTRLVVSHYKYIIRNTGRVLRILQYKVLL